MEKKKELLKYLNNLHTEVLARGQNEIGEISITEKKNADAYWKERAASLSPRSFLATYNIKEDKVSRQKGLDKLGLPYKRGFGVKNMMGLYHDNHVFIILYLGLKVHELSLKYKNRFDSRDIYISSLRAMKGKGKKYWLVYNYSNPFEFDKNGVMVSYISSWQLLSEYRGEGISSEFFYEGNNPEKYNPLIKEMNFDIAEAKTDMLKIFGFTRTQKEVLKYLALESSSEEVAETLGLAKRTIDDHNTNILSLGKELFPVNNFTTAKDVALYLKSQHII